MKDLSNLVPTGIGLTAGESMSAGNTVSRPLPPGIGAPGSTPVNPLPALSENDNPAIDIPPEGEHVYAPKFGTSPTHVPATWHEVGE